VRGIEASWVVIGDGVSPPIARGAVLVEDDGRIAAVGPADALRRARPEARFEPARDAVLLPGLVNAHAHLELSSLRGRVPGGRGFVPWVAEMLARRAELAPEADDEAIGAAVGELIAAGTAAVGDVSNTLATVRHLAGMPLVARVFAEVFGMTRAAGEVMLRLARERVAELGQLPENVSVALAPHTPFSVHPEVLSTIAALARGGRGPTSLHLAEHAAERSYLRDGGGPFAGFLADRGADAPDWAPPGLDPVRYAARLGALGPHVLAVHLTDARPDELDVVAAAGAPVVLCPRSNLHIELRLPPLEAMLAAGLRPALGTDSLASSASLDVLAEARALRVRFPNVRPGALVAMATGWGARALGLAHLLGTLTPGLRPGLLAFPHPPGAAPSDPEAFVLDPRARERQVLVRPGGRLTEEAPRP
jgi:cytosine/adenosine deaminase-related metal-dependent hydrolase